MLLLVLTALAATPAEKPIKPMATLAKAPTIDGDLSDLARASEFASPKSAKGPSATVALKAASRNDVVYLAVSVSDNRVTADDRLDVTVFFPGSGTTSRGFTYRFEPSGAPASAGEADPPGFATKLVSAAAKPTKQGWSLELALPARALPRFQASKPLAVTLCADYRDIDEVGATAVTATTCPVGDMVGGPTRLPDTFRKALKLTPPADIEGIEARANGWLGISKLHFPTWVSSDVALTPELLVSLVAGSAAVDPDAVAVPVPKQLMLNDNRPLFTVLTGTNPFTADTCNSAHELRLVLYVVGGTTANRVLEWPVVTCSLGRAMRFEMGADGTLMVGFTSGATQHFVWSDDHFERSELGRTSMTQHGSLL
ncbi:MAG: hypothetical protein JNG84_07835 [Archangium sp.]|nr:hypothetical protein [Archangium sp.]